MNGHFGTARRGLGGLGRPAQSPPRSTKCNSPPINGQCTNFILYALSRRFSSNTTPRCIERIRGTVPLCTMLIDILHLHIRCGAIITFASKGLISHIIRSNVPRDLVLPSGSGTYRNTSDRSPPTSANQPGFSQYRWLRKKTSPDVQNDHDSVSCSVERRGVYY